MKELVYKVTVTVPVNSSEHAAYRAVRDKIFGLNWPGAEVLPFTFDKKGALAKLQKIRGRSDHAAHGLIDEVAHMVQQS